MESVREVSLGEARPGDWVTLSGPLLGKDDMNPGPYVCNGVLYLFDGEDKVSIDERRMTVVVERVVETTDQEPRGLGAVVRTDDGDVFVRQNRSGGTPWQRCVGNNLTWENDYTWAGVLLCDSGRVEVLSEGWTP